MFQEIIKQGGSSLWEEDGNMRKKKMSKIPRLLER